MNTSIIILAAGQGKRMNSALPKVLQPLAGRPLLGHVIACSQAVGADDICVVYGHGGDQVRAAFGSVDIRWALQAEQHGTKQHRQLRYPGLYFDVPRRIFTEFEGEGNRIPGPCAKNNGKYEYGQVGPKRQK